ncbi:hypothetical protein GA0115240_16098 [Streptomyces sp. DvalAA-14]|nr:hypothetical protein GA0115240_16098 [Streptomyces sp. DvalAA-14]
MNQAIIWVPYSDTVTTFAFLGVIFALVAIWLYFHYRN